jgi:hypothetical protein
MNKPIHVRDFNGKWHRILATRAKERGLSLSEYVRQELGKIASRPTVEEFSRNLVDLRREGHVSQWSSQLTVRMIHEGRAQRDEQIAQALGERNDGP